jgi:heterotetrameric sarcosine oxidase gamma subunit
VLESAWGAAVPPVGAGAILPNGRIFCLREDFLLAWARPGGEEGIIAELAGALEQIQELVTVTDATQGRAALRLVGPASAALLCRICGLDFGPGAFPNLAIRASSVAKTPAWVLRDDLGDLPSFVVVGARSLGAYLWEVSLEAGRDLEAQPLGQAALEALSVG